MAYIELLNTMSQLSNYKKHVLNKHIKSTNIPSSNFPCCHPITPPSIVLFPKNILNSANHSSRKYKDQKEGEKISGKRFYTSLHLVKKTLGDNAYD